MPVLDRITASLEQALGPIFKVALQEAYEGRMRCVAATK
jgi:hypothetical protein